MECEPSKRRMEDNTTNSEAMTETIAENPNANLSLDSLAQSFVDKVEEQTEDQPESEAQPDPLIESVEAEADYIQVSYNIGGATLGLALVDTDNSDYTANREERKSVISLGMEF